MQRARKIWRASASASSLRVPASALATDGGSDSRRKPGCEGPMTLRVEMLAVRIASTRRGNATESCEHDHRYPARSKLMANFRDIARWSAWIATSPVVATRLQDDDRCSIRHGAAQP